MTGTNDAEPVMENQATASEGPRIVFLGDSITAAYGLPEEQGYVHLLQTRFDSLGIPAGLVNAGVSGDTSTGGLNRLDWVLSGGVDILVLELGGNDGLRGIDLTLTRRNLGAIIEQTRAVNPDVRIVLAGMQVPPNLGTVYTAEFSGMYPSLADEYDTELIPFLLEDVALVDGRMQNDGIHPTASGHAIMAETTWSALKPLVDGFTTP